MEKRKFELPLLVALSMMLGLIIATGGCGDDNGQQQPGIAPSPTASPSPSPSPTPTPVPTSWLNLHLSKDCPYPECPAREGFDVDSSGFYSYGGGPSGFLSSLDFNKLTDQASRVAAQNLSGPRSCVAIDVLPGMSGLSINMTLNGGYFPIVYDLDTQEAQFCWQGDRGRAEALASTLDDLASKYAPR